MREKVNTLIFALLIVSGPTNWFTTKLINVDILPFLVFASIPIFFINISRAKYSKIQVTNSIILLVILAYALITSIYSPSQIYIWDKLISLTFITFLYFFSHTTGSLNYSAFFKIIEVYSILIATVLIFFSNITPETYFLNESFNIDYLAISSLLFIGLAYRISNNKKYWFIYPMLIFLLGARGPFIFSMILILFTYRIKILRYIPALIVSSITIITIISSTSSTLLNRFQSLLNYSTDKSFNSRIEMLEFSLLSIGNSFENLIFGLGFGAFGIEFLKKDIRAYPHNIFLEMWYELGLIGLVMFTIFIVSHFRSRSGTNPFLFICVFELLNSLKSSSIIDMWILILCLGQLTLYENSYSRL